MTVPDVMTGPVHPACFPHVLNHKVAAGPPASGVPAATGQIPIQSCRDAPDGRAKVAAMASWWAYKALSKLKSAEVGRRVKQASLPTPTARGTHESARPHSARARAMRHQETPRVVMSLSLLATAIDPWAAHAGGGGGSRVLYCGDSPSPIMYQSKKSPRQDGRDEPCITAKRARHPSPEMCRGRKMWRFLLPLAGQNTLVSEHSIASYHVLSLSP